MKQPLTIAHLRELMSYDAGTGALKWLARRSNHIDAGTIAGSVNRQGYIQITIAGGTYRAHRVAWAIVTGEWPSSEVDHINGVKSDNRWTNLRVASRPDNVHNRPRPRTGGRFPIGVSLATRTNTNNPYKASISFSGRKLQLGYFPTPEAAGEAYLQKARERDGEFHPAALAA